MLLVDNMSQIYGFILKTEQKFCNFATMTKQNILAMGLLMCLWLTALTGCDRQQQRDAGLRDYTVTCTLDGKLHHDSATLLVLEEDYDKLRMCATARAQNGTFTFKGQTDGARVALIRWDKDTVNPFHFVLEPGDIRLNINPGSWSASGSAQNAEYLQFINQRNDIMNRRVATWQEYLKAAANASLTREEELRMVRQDSLLNDTLQRITVERINRGDAVGRIIRERYAGQLDQEHKRQLNK